MRRSQLALRKGNKDQHQSSALVSVYVFVIMHVRVCVCVRLYVLLWKVIIILHFTRLVKVQSLINHHMVEK